MITRALGAVVACSLAIACVPASEKLRPAGAAGFVTEPSEATRGEPFHTRDGWRITLERFVLQVFVTATSIERGPISHDVHLFDATKWAVALYAPGVPVGPARASTSISTRACPSPKAGRVTTKG